MKNRNPFGHSYGGRGLGDIIDPWEGSETTRIVAAPQKDLTTNYVFAGLIGAAAVGLLWFLMEKP